MISLRDRLKMAWRVFQCQPFEIPVEPYHISNKLKPGTECDSNWREPGERIPCGNKGAVCLTRTVAKFQLEHDDHEHLCFACAEKIKGRYSTSALKK